ncbi:MAG: hypothetical protein K0S74_78 [Chlamydiales bacterium]|jgi:uncharacterized protein (DUF2267 family)|nr:hypothetical protein [Chlamydiales bacterium]
MSQSCADLFTPTLQKTDAWLNDLMLELSLEPSLDNKHKAYSAMRAVLHALRDRLSVDVVAHFSAQLPMLIRGFFFEGWHPAGTPLKIRNMEDFLDLVCQYAHDTPFIVQNTEDIARSVFMVLCKHLGGEMDKLKLTLPEQVTRLWPAAYLV